MAIAAQSELPSETSEPPRTNPFGALAVARVFVWVRGSVHVRRRGPRVLFVTEPPATR